MNKKTLSSVIWIISILFFFLISSLSLNVYQFQKIKDNLTDENIIQIERVIDGDTFITAGSNIRMRLSNIEAPELENCGGKDAKEGLEKYVKGKKVKISYVGEDVFNRSIVILYVGDLLINEKMLESGLVRYDGSKSLVRDRLYVAYQKAVQEKKGIFGPPCRSEKPDNSKCLIKGNVNKHNKDKTYRFPGCSEYQQSIVEKDLGDRWFCSEEVAQNAGFTKASNCFDKKYSTTSSDNLKTTLD